MQPPRDAELATLLAHEAATVETRMSRSLNRAT